MYKLHLIETFLFRLIFGEIKDNYVRYDIINDRQIQKLGYRHTIIIDYSDNIKKLLEKELPKIEGEFPDSILLLEESNSKISESAYISILDEESGEEVNLRLSFHKAKHNKFDIELLFDDGYEKITSRNTLEVEIIEDDDVLIEARIDIDKYKKTLKYLKEKMISMLKNKLKAVYG